MNNTVYKIAQEYNGILKDYVPFSKNNIEDSIKKLISEAAYDYYNRTCHAITATDYMKLVRCGNRSQYEEKYFERRHKLNSLVAALYYDVDVSDLSYDDILDAVINLIWTICEESSWCLPAHNTYIRDTPQIILPDINRPVIDLFACETGATLSMVYYTLKDKLDSISPLICERILYEVNKRITEPYINSHFWWMGNNDEPMCNWTVWCTQNVLLCSFLLPNNNRRTIFEKACYSIDCFLKDYGDDGCCDEGPQYYRHAGLCLFGCIDILNNITDSAFVSLYNNDKIRNIAEYIVNIHACGKYYINYADSSPLAGSLGVREYLFAKSCNLPSMISLAVNDYKESLVDKTLFNDESVKLNLYYRIQTIYHSNEIQHITAAKTENDKDIYYESVGIGILRSPNYTVSIKAGNNGDSHNHNDTGSIILYKGTDPIFVDAGPLTYSQKTFSDKRYEIWTMQSGYHNLPTIDGYDEINGKQYGADSVKVSLSKTSNSEKFISMNIEKAYPIINTTDMNDFTYNRKISINSDNDTVILTDSLSSTPDKISNGVILNFITFHKPEVNESKQIIKIGSASVSYSGAEFTTIEPISTDDARLKKSWSHELYRLRLTMTSKEFKLVIQ